MASSRASAATTWICSSYMHVEVITTSLQLKLQKCGKLFCSGNRIIEGFKLVSQEWDITLGRLASIVQNILAVGSGIQVVVFTLRRLASIL